MYRLTAYRGFESLPLRHIYTNKNKNLNSLKSFCLSVLPRTTATIETCAPCSRASASRIPLTPHPCLEFSDSLTVGCPKSTGAAARPKGSSAFGSVESVVETSRRAWFKCPGCDAETGCRPDEGRRPGGGLGEGHLQRASDAPWSQARRIVGQVDRGDEPDPIELFGRRGADIRCMRRTVNVHYRCSIGPSGEYRQHLYGSKIHTIALPCSSRRDAAWPRSGHARPIDLSRLSASLTCAVDDQGSLSTRVATVLGSSPNR